MSYEWDPKKAVGNLRKHDIDFADAATVFEDEMALTIDDDDLDEKRFVTIGMDALARVLVVSYTWRGDNLTPGEVTTFALFLLAKPARKSGANTKRENEKTVRFQ